MMKNAVKIVDMLPEHLEGVMEVEHLSFSIPWTRNAFLQEITANKFAIYITALSGTKVVGYSGMWKVFEEGHITNIAVHPEFRKSGIGSLLLEKLIENSRKVGIESLTLEVRKSNIAAQRLYTKYGFKAEGERIKYYSDNGENAIIMWKRDINLKGEVKA